MRSPPAPDAPKTPDQKPAGRLSRQSAAPSLNSDVLFSGGNEVVIRHGPDVYRLRLTRQNRLILTK
ncbi:MAG: hemin uptake protein HemP [Sulfuritalea sp.]|nr:hemin uptake protein HemP [Sulfuritalea sp.]